MKTFKLFSVMLRSAIVGMLAMTFFAICQTSGPQEVTIEGPERVADGGWVVVEAVFPEDLQAGPESDSEWIELSVEMPE